MSQYPFDGLTGGGNALDGIPYAGLNALSKAYGADNGVVYSYEYDPASTAAESSPNVIIPDDNATGLGRWLLMRNFGAVLNAISLTIQDGTNANTLKCTVTALYNGQSIASVDNIGKGATVGDFTLDAAGEILEIESTGLIGTLINVLLSTTDSDNGTDVRLNTGAGGGNIIIYATDPGSSTFLDITIEVDTGQIRVGILFVTDGK